MPCAFAPDSLCPMPQPRGGGAARAALVLAPLAMTLSGLIAVVDSAPVAPKGRVAMAQQSAECIVARAVFAGAQVRRVAEPSD